MQSNFFSINFLRLLEPEMQDIIAIVKTLVGIAIPLLGSAMIPDGLQRWGAAVFGAIGIFVFIGFVTGSEPSSFAIGLGIGMILATLKLATGLRWL